MGSHGGHVAQGTKKLMNQEAEISKSYLDDSFLDRVRRSYQLASRESATTADSMWTTIGKLQQPIHDALAATNNNALKDIFSDPSATDLYYGVDPLRTTGRPRGDQPAELEAWQKRHEAMCTTLILRLAEALGVRRWLPEDSELKPSYYPDGHVVDPEIDEMLNEIETALGFSFSFPNPFPREPGIRTSRGLASFRAINALYQTYRIGQELSIASNKSVVEIGPGIGRTVYYCWMSGVRDYTTIDLPLGVAAQACFLGATLGPEAIWMIGDDVGLQPGRIRLLPSTHPLQFGSRVGVVLNADSITEMGGANSARYAAWIADSADAFLSINHEANAPTVSDLAQRFFQGAHSRRFLYWMRQGWVEEVFVFGRPEQTPPETGREREALMNEIAGLRASASWKITAPLRALSAAFSQRSG
jgi:hypothetical protein